MKKISYILMATGGVVTALGAMCDTDEIYYGYLISVIAVALMLVILGMYLYKIAEKRERQRRRDYYRKHQKDKFDREMEIIELKEVR